MYRKPGCVVKKNGFIKKDRNFTSKTRSSIRKQYYVSKIRLYSLKNRFYKERLKFYLENEIFYRRKQYYLQKIRFSSFKKIGFIKRDRNFILKTRFSIEENSIMYGKPGCIVKKKHRFYKEILTFYIENKKFYQKIVLCIENPVIQLKKNGFIKRD